MMNRKGQFAGNLENLMLAGIMFVGFIAAIAFGALIVTNIDSNFTAGSTAKNISGEGLKGLKTFGTNSTTIATVIVGVFILVLLIAGLYSVIRRQ